MNNTNKNTNDLIEIAVEAYDKTQAMAREFYVASKARRSFGYALAVGGVLATIFGILENQPIFFLILFHKIPDIYLLSLSPFASFSIIEAIIRIS